MLKRIPIDYTRYLRAEVVDLVLLPPELSGLHEREVVIASGLDGIPDRKAEVLRIDGARVTIRFLEPLRAAS